MQLRSMLEANKMRLQSNADLPNNTKKVVELIIVSNVSIYPEIPVSCGSHLSVFYEHPSENFYLVRTRFLRAHHSHYFYS